MDCGAAVLDGVPDRGPLGNYALVGVRTNGVDCENESGKWTCPLVFDGSKPKNEGCDCGCDTDVPARLCGAIVLVTKCDLEETGCGRGGIVVKRDSLGGD